MASRREFKKNLNDDLSEIIEQCYVIQLSSDDKKAAKADKIIDEAIASFDTLIEKLYQKNVESAKGHYKELKQDLAKSTDKLMKQIEKLND